MPYQGKLSSGAGRKTRKYRKLDSLKDSHLVRGVIIEKEKFKPTFMNDNDVPDTTPMMDRYIPIKEEIYERLTRQDIRCKNSRTYEKKLTQHEEKVIQEYINELNFNDDEILS